MACLEAMAAGLPVIGLDIGGTASQVSPSTGIKVPAVSPQQLVDDLMLAMCQLAEDHDLRRRMGDAAQKYICNEFSWEAKAQSISALYDRVQVISVHNKKHQ
jgi:glycosyltransferase involved in cell wall biosynthesis